VKYSKLSRVWEFILSTEAATLGFINMAIYFIKGLMMSPSETIDLNFYTLLLIVQIIVGITVSGMENILKKKQEKA